MAASKPAASIPGHPATVPAARVDAAIHDYSRWSRELAASHKVSGFATALVVDGKVRFEYTAGDANAATGAPVTPTTVFRIASLSKAFASALAGLLIRQGDFTWDTHVADVLPFFHLKDDTATAQLSVRDLLSQRTGLPHNTYDSALESNVPYEQLVRQLDQVDLTCDVGDCYGYQNIAFSLLGDIVYARTGNFYDYQVAKYLFHPLGMQTASYGRRALEDSASWARPHTRRNGHFVPLAPKPNYYWVSPAAGVNASLRDMEQWLMAQMGNRPDVLPNLLLDVLHAPAVSTPDQTRLTPWRRARVRHASYALAWRVYDYAGHKLVYHAGAVEGYRAMIGFLPDANVGLVMLWNCGCAGPSGLMPMFLDRVLGLPATDWAQLTASPPQRVVKKRATPRPAKHRRRR